MMRPRWRVELRVRMLLRLLLDEHVPLGVLSRCVARVMATTDAELPDEQRVHGASMVGALARDIGHELVGEEPFTLSVFGEKDPVER